MYLGHEAGAKPALVVVTACQRPLAVLRMEANSLGSSPRLRREREGDGEGSRDERTGIDQKNEENADIPTLAHFPFTPIFSLFLLLPSNIREINPLSLSPSISWALVGVTTCWCLCKHGLLCCSLKT